MSKGVKKKTYRLFIIELIKLNYTNTNTNTNTKL